MYADRVLAIRSSMAAFSILVLAACAGRAPPPTPPPRPAPAQVAVPVPVPVPAEVPRYRGEVRAELLVAMAERPVVKLVERFNKIEPVFHLDLGDGVEIAFKPQTRTRPGIWRNDVTAAVVGDALGLGDRVPPAIGRHVPLAILDVKPGDGLRPDPGAPGMVYGSAIYWMPVLQRSRLSGDTGRKRWSKWLAQRYRPPSGAEAGRAEQVSSLIVFDYLQANIDRFDHPSNLRDDEHGVLVYRDNNEAWMNGPMSALGINRDLLRASERFSRGLIDRLRRLDRAALEALLPPGGRGPMLDEAHFAAYERRRAVVLGHVDALIARYGEDRVLAWP